MRARISKLSRPAQLIAAVGVLVLALGGTATAARLITGAQIKDGTITGRDIKAGSISASDLRGDAANALRSRDGIRGETGATGPRGDTGAAGEGRTRYGPKGRHGRSRPAGTGRCRRFGWDPTGVFDADGNRLGDYLSGVTSPVGIGAALTFLNRNDDRVYSIDPGTGAYKFASVSFEFESTDCSGPGYVIALAGPRKTCSCRRGTRTRPPETRSTSLATRKTLTFRSHSFSGYACQPVNGGPWTWPGLRGTTYRHHPRRQARPAPHRIAPRPVALGVARDQSLWPYRPGARRRPARRPPPVPLAVRCPLPPLTSTWTPHPGVGPQGSTCRPAGSARPRGRAAALSATRAAKRSLGAAALLERRRGRSR